MISKTTTRQVVNRFQKSRLTPHPVLFNIARWRKIELLRIGSRLLRVRVPPISSGIVAQLEERRFVLFLPVPLVFYVILKEWCMLRLLRC